VQIDRKLLVALPVVAAATLLIGLVVWLTGRGGDPLGERQSVRDRPSSLRWEMRGEPIYREELTTRTTDDGRSEVAVRTYTVDHGDWVERVQVFDAGASDIDFADAALGIFGDDDGTLEDRAFVTVAEQHPGATGRSGGSVRRGTEPVAVEARVFVSQISGYVIAGGVAVPAGADVPEGFDLETESDDLRASVSVP
jgi:hypothetical protein